MELEQTKRRNDSRDLIYRLVVISCVTCFLFNTTFLVVSLICDHWVFGYVFCQIYALLSQVLIAGSAWVIALAALERIFKCFKPEDYDATFSDINIRILLYGIYLIFIILYTAPVYGWGEYSQFRGGLLLTLSMSGEYANNDTAGGTHMTSVYLQVGNTSGCNDTGSLSGGGHVFNPAAAAHVLRMALQEEYTCEARQLTRRGIDAVVRFLTQDQLSQFHTDFVAGSIAKKIEGRFRDLFSACDQPERDVTLNIYLQQNDMEEYANIHLPFQDIGVCSLDFSPVNPSIGSWIPLVVVSSTIMPYAFVCMSAVTVYITERSRGSFALKTDKTLCLLLTSIISPCLTAPYYYVNICNYRSIHVNHILNVCATVLYHTQSLAFVILSSTMTYCKQRIGHITGGHITDGKRKNGKIVLERFGYVGTSRVSTKDDDHV